jgi:hypothetical protein
MFQARHTAKSIHQLIALILTFALWLNATTLPVNAANGRAVPRASATTNSSAPNSQATKDVWQQQSATANSSVQPSTLASRPSQATESYGKLPLSFEMNQGQADPAVKFLARGHGYNLSLSVNKATLTLRGSKFQVPGSKSNDNRRRTTDNGQRTTDAAVITMTPANANTAATIEGVEPLPGKVNYFFGNDPSQWHTDVPTYAKVKYHDLYPGVDMTYYGNGRQLEYDFILAPGADASVIKLDFAGAQQLRLNARGDLTIKTGNGSALRMLKPNIYQEINGERKQIAGGYVLHQPLTSQIRNPQSAIRNRTVGFEVGE